jgi:hypothetical protein
MRDGGGGRAPDAGEVGELDQEAHVSEGAFPTLLFLFFFCRKVRDAYFFSGYGFVDWDILL